MSESTARDAAAVPLAVGTHTLTAGMMLRQARQAQGLHIAALAASIKVPQQKLELLESDRLDELPDATFVRALAQTVCRVLKIDAVPVLARLPENAAQKLDRMNAGLGQPFRDRSGRDEGIDLSLLRHPVAWGTGLLILAAAALFFVPSQWTRWLHPEAAANAPVTATPDADASSPAPGAIVAAAAPQASGAALTPPVLAASGGTLTPVDDPSVAGALPAGAATAPSAPEVGAAGTLVMRATSDSWIEVVDGQGRALVSRVLKPGEILGLDGAPPFKIKVGNAAVTQMTYKGQSVDLSAATRENVARLELK